MSQQHIQKWEYHTENISPHTQEYFDRISYLGKAGWEHYLIQETQFGFLFYFKRPITITNTEDNG